MVKLVKASRYYQQTSEKRYYYDKVVFVGTIGDNIMQQLTIEDLERIKLMESQPSRTAFIDECGNFGFDFTSPGTSKYYVICAVCIPDNNIDELQTMVEKVRASKFGTGEMKSSTVSEYKRRSNIIADLLPLDFRVILLVVDKQAFHNDSPLSTYKRTFIKYLHQRLYDVLYYVYPKLKIVEDQTGTSEFQNGFREYVKNNRPQFDFLGDYDFDYVDSKNSVLVQLADMVGGTINKYYIDPDAPNYLEMLRAKIIRLETFPNNMAPYFANRKSQDIKFNKDIFDLSIRCANLFIEKNENSEDYEKRMQIAFLKYLLFQVRNVNAEAYVSSNQLVAVLSEYANKRVTKDFLYRRVIAQLRESNVIISSCGHGYKIPINVDDIYSYLNQTNSLVSPMLHRVELCRNLIFQQTDKQLDILEDDAFVKYKKYFDE